MECVYQTAQCSFPGKFVTEDDVFPCSDFESFYFQYILLPFARFYKNQIVREALFSLMMQIREL